MEDYCLDIVGDQRPFNPSDLPPFTLVGPLPDRQPVSSPWDRFGVVSRLEYYTEEDLVTIVERAARILN